MSLIECVSATAGFTIWASFDMDTKNADYEGATFNDIGVGASIGGIVVEGSFSVKNDDEYGDGYCGTLKIALPATSLPSMPMAATSRRYRTTPKSATTERKYRGATSR